MGTLYERIEFLCTANGMNITSMCKEAGVSRGSITDLKVGRNKTLKPDTLDKIADYFDTSVDYLLGRTDAPESSDRFGLEDPADHSLDVYREQEKKSLINDDEELTEYLDELRSRPEKRMLFSVTKNATKAQIEAIVKMIEEMKGD